MVYEWINVKMFKKSFLKAENVGRGPSIAVEGPFSARSAVSQVTIDFISAMDTENRVRQKQKAKHTTHTAIRPSSKLLRGDVLLRDGAVSSKSFNIYTRTYGIDLDLSKIHRFW